MSSEEFDPPVGVAQIVAPGIRRVLAPNPSPMTQRGTNTYILGQDKCVVIDPGPDDPYHMRALMEAIDTAEVCFIFVTHSHIDHSPLAPALGLVTGAPVLAYGDSQSGRSAVMNALAADGLAGGGEGVDPFFAPDQCVTDGEIFATSEWQLEAIYTPGHMGNHIAIRWGDAIFCGDLVMGWASSLVSPPDGDLTDFMTSCEKLKSRDPKVLYPGHGAPVQNAIERIDWLVAHRKERTADILTTLAAAASTIDQLTSKIYADTAPELHPAAARNIFAHLIDLHQRQLVVATPELNADATFRLSPSEGS